jgi:hypothetical protein
MNKDKIMTEINIICNTYGCRTVDPQNFKNTIYKLIEKYSAGDINIINYSPSIDSNASRTRNRSKKRRSI